MSIDSVLSEALTLPASERSEVAAQLLASLDETRLDSPDAVTAAWSEELERRARRAFSGDDPGEPWSAVRNESEPTLQGDLGSQVFGGSRSRIG